MQKNIPLSNYSNYKIGGPAKFFLEVNSAEDLKQDFSEHERITILGGGTNILISDEGFDGLVLLNKIGGIEAGGEHIKFGSGVMIDELLKYCVEHGLSGLEWAGGLPGTIGAAVRGNAGAFKGETKDSVLEVESVDIHSKEKMKRKNEECNFGYRWSVYKENPNEFITSVTLKLEKGESSNIKKLIDEKINYRKEKHPMEYPNIGSTFKNIPVEKISDKQREEFKDFTKDDPFPVVHTTKLLALADLKGKREGDAQISEKHPNFIVNLGNAKASDVQALINLAKKTVKEKFNIDLEEEIAYLS
jgi:UDP-N-acetylmuramate dehydrogenase